MADLSTPANRVAFTTAIDGGEPLIAVALFPVLADCHVGLPDATAMLLGLTPPATFAMAVAAMQARRAAGLAPAW